MVKRKSVGDGRGNGLLVWAVVAAVLSVVAFLMVSGTFKAISLAPETGTASVDIVKTIRLTMSLDTINFGAGYIALPGGTTLDTQNVSNNHTDPDNSWLDVNDVPVEFQAMGFVVENDGNVDVDMNLRVLTEVSCASGAAVGGGDCWLTTGLSATKATLDYKVRNCGNATSMAGVEDCRTDPLGLATVTPADTTVDAEATNSLVTCAMGAGSDFETAGGFNVYIPVPEILIDSDDWICDKFRYTPDEDEIRIDLKLFLPADIEPTAGVPAVNTLELTVGEDLTVGDDAPT